MYFQPYVVVLEIEVQIYDSSSVIKGKLILDPRDQQKPAT